jgi:hypothetical protein
MLLDTVTPAAVTVVGAGVGRQDTVGANALKNGKQVFLFGALSV